jgi:hypothetical protein
MSQPFRDWLQRRRSCLFVASGSSRRFLRVWRPHFDAVAVHQQTALYVPGRIDFATFINHETAEMARPAFKRIKWFLCAESLSGTTNETLNVTRSPEECGIPTARTVTFPRRFYACTRDADHWIGETDTIWVAWGSAVTIQLLAMMGFRWIFCLGHSDDKGEVHPPYVPLRTACECAADAVADRYGTRVVFWTPEHTPENWRTHLNRGFLFAR